EIVKPMVLTKLRLSTAAVLCAGFVFATVGAALVRTGSAQDTKPLASKAIEAARKGDARAEAPASEDAKELEGEWQLVQFEREGERSNPYRVRAIRTVYVFKGGQITERGEESAGRNWRSGSYSQKYQFKLDPSKSPKEIDKQEIGKTARWLGIYSLDKGRL